VDRTDVQGVSFGFVAGVVRRANGNTVLCNWGGHGDASGPAVIEITPDKKVVWSTPAGIPNNVSTVQVIENSVPTNNKK